MLPAPPAKPPATDDSAWRDALRRTAWTAGLLALVVVVLLGINYVQGRAVDPLASKELASLKTALAQRPQDEALKQQIRDADLRLRRAYARHADLANDGAWLLAASLAVFLLTLKTATYRKKLPRPEKVTRTPVSEARAATRARRAVAVVGFAVAGLTLLAAWRAQTHLSPALLAAATNAPPAEATASGTQLASTTAAPATVPTTPPEAAPTSLAPPTPEEIKRQWPRFRGPGGLGISAYTNVPAAWNVQTGEHVRWKSPVPLVAPSSPIVWGRRVFLTGGNAQKREVYCYDTETGKLLWQKAIDAPPGADAKELNVNEEAGGYAVPTAATDGHRVYAIFANGDVGAVDFTGRQVWAINLGLPDNSYGHATSLDVHQDRLLILLDQGDGKDNQSKLLALDTATGKTAWESAPRSVPNSWTTPIVIPVGQAEQIITCANPWVIAYNPAQGQEIWRAKALYGEVTPSPVFANGLVFTAMEGEFLSAIRPDGTGDVTATHIVWKAEDGLPDICSPLADGSRVYVLTTYGGLTCYAAADGKKLWEHELEIGVKASPSLVGNRVLLLGEKGTVVQIEAADSFKELSRFEMEDEIEASPAFADGRIYIRTKKFLYCLGAKAP